MIDWIEYNIECDPESVNLMLTKLDYSKNLNESIEIILHCEQYKHLLPNYSKVLFDCSKATLKWLSMQRTT